MRIPGQARRRQQGGIWPALTAAPTSQSNHESLTLYPTPYTLIPYHCYTTRVPQVDLSFLGCPSEITGDDSISRLMCAWI